MTNYYISVFKKSLLALSLTTLLGQSLLGFSSPINVSAQSFSQDETQNSLSQLQAIQQLNQANSKAPAQSSLINPTTPGNSDSRIIPDTGFDILGTDQVNQDNASNQVTPHVEPANTKPESSKPTNLLQNILSLGGVKAHAQTSTDPFLQGFDQGDIQFPWDKDKAYLLTSGYSDFDHVGVNSYLLNFATGTDKITDPVLAMTDGIVVDAQNTCVTNSPTYGCNDGWGKYVIMQVSTKDGQNRYIEYHHLSGESVTIGKPVPRGQIIGYVGDNGFTNSVPAIQVGLFDKPHTDKTYKTLAFPPIQGRDVELNESPVTDFGAIGKPVRRFHHFVSANTKTTNAYKSRFYFNAVYGLFRNSGYNIPSGIAGDPVNTATGAFTTTATDVNMTGPGKNIQEELAPELEVSTNGLHLSRTYNSSDSRIGLLGKGWTTDLLTYVDFFSTPQKTGSPLYQFGVSVPGGNTDLFDRNTTNCPANNQQPTCYSFTKNQASTGTTATLSYVPATTFSSSQFSWVEGCPTSSSSVVAPDCFDFLYTDKYGNQTLYHWDTATN